MSTADDKVCKHFHMFELKQSFNQMFIIEKERECNVVVCSFDVLGRNSMVCRGETASITSARSVASLIAEP